MVRMTVAPAFVISMAVAAAILSGSGFNDEVGISYGVGLDNAADDLREQAHQDFEGSVISQAINLIGLAISGISIVVDTFVWVYLFPLALTNIGFPWWFAYPVGLPVLYINLIGTAALLRGINIR